MRTTRLIPRMLPAVVLAALVAVFAACQKPPDPDYENPSGDPLFYNVQWNEDIGAITKKAGKPDSGDDHFLTYEGEEVFGVPCKVVMVVDFSYSYPGLYSVTHNFGPDADLEHVKQEMLALFGEPMTDDGDSVLWILGGTTIHLGTDRLSFINTGV